MPGPSRGSGGLGRSADFGGLESGAPPPHGSTQGAGCCWPLFCVLFFVALASSGILAIQKVKDCWRGHGYDYDYGNGHGNHHNHHHNSKPHSCTDYNSVHSVGVVIIILICCYYCCCCCCCCRRANRRPRDDRYDPIDETVAGSTYIMATDASTPAVVYATEPFQPSAPTLAGTGSTNVASNVYGPLDPA